MSRIQIYGNQQIWLSYLLYTISIFVSYYLLYNFYHYIYVLLEKINKKRNNIFEKIKILTKLYHITDKKCYDIEKRLTNYEAMKCNDSQYLSQFAKKISILETNYKRLNKSFVKLEKTD